MFPFLKGNRDIPADKESEKIWQKIDSNFTNKNHKSR